MTMEFITLTTGGTTMASRAEMSADTLDLADDLLNRRVSGSWAIDIVDAEQFEVRWCGRAVSRCILCAHADETDRLWEIAEGLSPAPVVLHRPRRTPWFAAALLPDCAALGPSLLMALPWLEIGIAWRLLDQRAAT